uniref:Ribosomal protein large subunit 11 n=1 Tax=Paramoeba pemaquidensis TaxID=180228 RepID=A0A1D8DB94_9EUKA|nr:ribosomal protein large subunit 11 [Paramoeba pemaquidensis]AOS85561.1 ribosomal protein large subunit 11 [Paramoeba pemaquidensis]
MSNLFNNTTFRNKRIKRFFNLFVQSSSAAFEDPSIGPNLSPYMARDKIKLFCEELNKKCNMLKSGLKLLVRLYLFDDKSFFFIIKGLPFSLLLKLLLNLKYNQFSKISKSITIYEAFDLLYIKNIYNNKYLSYDNIFFKNQLVDNIYSIKNLIITK